MPQRTSPHVWVPTTYFAEGFPYTLVNSVAEILFKQLGASLALVGLTSLLHLPWNLKFLWAPLLDRFETKRTFLIAMQFIGAALLVGLSPFVRGTDWLGLVAVLFMLLAIVSATNDMAIDGYYMEALTTTEQSRFVGYRASSYKGASLVIKGGLPVLVVGVGWSLGLLAMAGVLALCATAHLFLLPHSEPRKERFVVGLQQIVSARILLTGAVLGGVICLGAFVFRLEAVRPLVERWAFLGQIGASGFIAIALLLGLVALARYARRISNRWADDDSAYARAFVQLASTPGIGRLLAFVVLFRTGESLLGKMKWPFFSDQLGLGLAEYGLANGTVGVVASFAATFLGGHLISRDGLRRWFWPFVLAQNVLNLLYVALAATSDHTSLGLVTAVIAVDEFGSGLGTAVLMVFLMRVCHPDHKATHFAVLTALMSLSFTFAGAASGFLAQALGYAGFFALSFAATVPMMALGLGLRLDEL